MESKMKSKILIGIIIALFVLAVGCSKETPAPEPIVTEEPMPALPVIDEEGIVDIEEEPVIDEPFGQELEEEFEGVVDVDETDEDDRLTAANFRIISLKDLKPYPKEMEITIGTTVEWRNINDNLQHIIGWRNQKNMGVIPEPILQGQSWSYTFTEPGEIMWFSTARPTIQGTITILSGEEE